MSKGLFQKKNIEGRKRLGQLGMFGKHQTTTKKTKNLFYEAFDQRLKLGGTSNSALSFLIVFYFKSRCLKFSYRQE